MRKASSQYYLRQLYNFDDPRDKLFFRQLTAGDKAELMAQQGESA